MKYIIIAGAVILAILLITVFACCKVAGDADRRDKK